jgi:tRNA (guanosine-2'-O-)-methyltransferase
MVPRLMRPANRQSLPSDPGKTSKFPRTGRRAERIAHVLRHRQPDLAVVLENVHDPHNIGAVLRSCDAVGVLAVHTVYSVEERPTRAFARSTSGSASKWIDIHHHGSIEDCYARLRREGHRILVAALTDESRDLYDEDFTAPIALVFGNEMRGATQDAVEQADGAILIPMMGMVESLNISVACAVALFEALRQRRSNGSYDSPRLSPDVLAQLQEEWLAR